MTSPGPFFVFICSRCRKRVNVESSKTDEEGLAVHEECLLSEVHSEKSKRQLTLPTGYDVEES